MEKLKIGQIYQHFKGGLYKIVMLNVNNTENGKSGLIYKSIKTNELWFREVEEFLDYISILNNTKIKRFELIERI